MGLVLLAPFAAERRATALALLGVCWLSLLPCAFVDGMPPRGYYAYASWLFAGFAAWLAYREARALQRAQEHLS